MEQRLHPITARLLTFVVALAAVIAGTQFALAGPASAHNELGWGFCQGGPKICISSQINGYGNYEMFSPPVGACWGITSFMNNAADAVDSHWGAQVTFYDGISCNPSYGWVTYGAWATRNDVGGWRNRFSALCVGPRGGSVGCP